MQGRPSAQTAQTPRPPPASASQSEALSEATEIAALQRSRQERVARWTTKKNASDSSIFELQRNIRRLEQEIKMLESIVAAEAATEARKNSWGTWLLSTLYKKSEESEEEKLRKDRERQERRIEKDMKERRLWLTRADLTREESLLKKAKEEADAADLVDQKKIRVIQDRQRIREIRERQERDKVERERIAKIWKQQQEQRERREREAAEALRKQQAEERAAEQKRRDEQNRMWQEIGNNGTRNRWEQYAHLNVPEGSNRQAYTSLCRHDGWWPKEQGRMACPECYQVWTYLLRCPGCEMKACPKCQAAIRPRIPRNAARTSRRDPPRARIPSPDFGYDY